MKNKRNSVSADNNNTKLTSERVDFSYFTDASEDAPIIFIEREDEGYAGKNDGSDATSHGKGKSMILVSIAIGLAALAIAIGGYIYYQSHVSIGVPVSCTPEQNIEKLKAQTPNEADPEVVISSDTILGVPLHFYKLQGLRAEISLEEPDTLDESVYLYSRCADHAADGSYLGSLVMNGTELQSDVSRLGYCAMLGNNMVVGVSRSEKVKEFAQEQGGCFFRQFILVSNGVIPNRFYLHGKVERRGLGRINDTYYYIETIDKETLWDFADALREYGFTDAIYITGGSDYSFYRTADGSRHDIGSVEDYPHTKWKGVIPWLVFRKR